MYYHRPSFSLSLLFVTQIRGHLADSSPPLRTTVRALHCYRKNMSYALVYVVPGTNMLLAYLILVPGMPEWTHAACLIFLEYRHRTSIQQYLHTTVGVYKYPCYQHPGYSRAVGVYEVPLLPTPRVLASITRRANTRHEYELGQTSHCQSGVLAMPTQCYALGRFFYTILIMRQQTESRPFFLSERPYDRNNDPKKHKSDHKLSFKLEKTSFQCVCTCGPNTSLKFQIENRKIERGIAEMPCFPFFVVITSLTY